MRRIIMFMFLLVIGCFSSVSYATINESSSNVTDTALFIQIDPNGVGKPKETEQLICSDVQKKLNASHHDIISTEKTQQDLRVYIRENADTLTKRDADEGYILKSKDFKALAQLENVRYIVLVSSRITSAETKANFWSGSRKNVTVLTEVVVYDAQESKYLMDEEFTNIGKTSGSNDRAYSRAIKEMLKQVNFTY